MRCHRRPDGTPLAGQVAVHVVGSPGPAFEFQHTVIQQLLRLRL
jgi:hypothetical protein